MEKTSFTGDSDDAFKRDVVRAKFLGHYAAGWDQPVLRKVFTHAYEPPLEVYQFGREGIDKVARLATIGGAALLAAAGK